MPAYRAELTLAQTVADIPADVADLMILVDDASPDNTAALARELGIDVYVHSENRGYGGNQKTCYTEALRSGADVVVLLHPDYQYEPKAVPLLIAPILAGDADMTFGSRFAGLGDPRGGGMPLYRYVGNRVTTVLENMMLGSRFTEMHSGLRAYTRRCLLSVPYLRYSDDFVFDSQMLIDAVTSGQRVVEVPIPTRYTEESSSIGVDNSLRYIAGSLGYCARRATERGRRGRRSPVANPQRARPVATRALPQVERTCPACAEEVHVDIRGHGEPAAVLACVRCGLVTPPGAPDRPADRERGVDGGPDLEQLCDRLLELAGGYTVEGDDLLVVGEDGERLARLAASAGWRTSTARAEELPTPTRGSGATARRAGTDSPRRGRFDALMLFDVLGDRPVDLLRGARPLLDPTGILVAAVPLSPVSSLAPGALPPSARDRVLFSPASVSTALARAGFRLVEWAVPGHEPLRRLPRLVASRIGSSNSPPAAGQAGGLQDRAVAFGIAIARSGDVSGSPGVGSGRGSNA
jgi:hypothetical protein